MTVIAPPHAIHFGFNMGFNEAVAVNFVSDHFYYYTKCIYSIKILNTFCSDCKNGPTITQTLWDC